MNKLKNTLKERILKSWKSTLLGIILLAVCSYALASGYFSGEAYVAILPLILLLFGMKDEVFSWFKAKKEDHDSDTGEGPPAGMSAGLIILPWLFFSLSSCVTYDNCREKFGGDTSYVEKTVYVPYEKITPGDSNSTTFNADTLRPGSVITVLDSNSKITIKYWKDRYTNLLNFQASIPPDTIHDTIPYQVKVGVPVFKDKPKTKGEIRLDKYKLVAAWIAPLLAIILIVAIILKFKNRHS